MPPEITPDRLRQAQFRSAFRGYDPAEVSELLQVAASALEKLDSERRKLVARLEETPSSDLEEELETVGRDITSILQQAREAAAAMRERASVDAARWRSEAMEEADNTRKEAAADAEALRRDAWVTGSELLEQTSTRAEDMRANAERDVLTVMGEAEREAHRLTSGARREAEDVVRAATMDAEQVTNEATKRRDEIIDAANRQAAAAQERARALEQRRDELLEELENVRGTLTRLEGSLEERREALDLTGSEPSSVKVVHPPADAKEQWQLGETVRVIPQDDGGPPDPEPGMAEDVSQDVTRLQSTAEPSQPASAPEPEAEVEAGPEEQVSPVEEPAPPVVEEPSGESDDLDALFASLRGGSEGVPSSTGATQPDDPGETETAPEPAVEPATTDWIEVRESRLLPITNRALRGVKKAMTAVQNVALDSLRTDDDWRPDDDAIAESVHAELVAVWSESFAAGHTVAEEMTGTKVKRPTTPQSKADKEFAADLAKSVSDALDKAGTGQRERQSAASRVFRVWRSDEAERRIREIALRGYEAGLEKSRSVSTAT